MKQIVLIILVFSLIACEDNTATGELFQGDWSIPQAEVKNGGPGVDGIPALENPEMIPPSEATYLNDEDLVVGFKVDLDARAYPHKILDWHEIINDNVQGLPIAITYCPLTGTGIGWDAIVDGSPTTFGVSGLLYNSNLIPYDRNSENAWSQMLLKSVNGSKINQEIKTFSVIETTWATWKEMYPETSVVSTNTGHSRNYNSFPYFINGTDYRTDPFLLFPVNNSDNTLEAKERVLGVINQNSVKAYRFSLFDQGTGVINTNEDLVIIGNSIKNFMVAYGSKLNDGTSLSFIAIQDRGEIVMEDASGSKWNIFGEAVSGPLQGEKLPATKSFIGYWFSWAAFYPEVVLEE